MIYAVLYVLCMGASTVLLEQTGLRFSPSLNLVFGSLIALCYFNLINFRKMPSLYRACYQNKREVILINLCVFIVWLSTVYGAVYAGASLFSLLFFGSLGATSRVAEYLQHKKPVEFLSLLLILGLLDAAIYLNVDRQFNIDIFKGVLCGVGGGVVGYFYLNLSGHFMKEHNLNATQILAMRFYLAVLLGFLFIPHGAITELTLHNFGLIFLVTCFNLMIPVYFSQRAVQVVGSEITGTIVSCMPFVAGIVEFFFVDTVPDHNFVIYVLYALIMGLPYLHFYLKKKAGA